MRIDKHQRGKYPREREIKGRHEQEPMQLPNEHIEIAFKDQYFDLKGLSVYSSLGVSSLRTHIKENGLPCYPVKNDQGKVTKILVKRSEFDLWMDRWKQDIRDIVDEVMESLKTH